MLLVGSIFGFIDVVDRKRPFSFLSFSAFTHFVCVLGKTDYNSNRSWAVYWWMNHLVGRRSVVRSKLENFRLYSRKLDSDGKQQKQTAKKSIAEQFLFSSSFSITVPGQPLWKQENPFHWRRNKSPKQQEKSIRRSFANKSTELTEFGQKSWLTHDKFFQRKIRTAKAMRKRTGKMKIKSRENVMSKIAQRFNQFDVFGGIADGDKMHATVLLYFIFSIEFNDQNGISAVIKTRWAKKSMEKYPKTEKLIDHFEIIFR